MLSTPHSPLTGAFAGGPTGPPARPFAVADLSWASVRTPLVCAGAYVALATAYVLVSSSLAARMSRDLEGLKQLEMSKGVAFVLVTGLLMFAFLSLAQRRVARITLQLEHSERALATAQRATDFALLASSIAHDANNVLTVLLAELELSRAEPSMRGDEGLRRTQYCAERLVELNRRLIDASNGAKQREPRPVEVARCVRDSLATLRAHQVLRRCRIALFANEELVVMADPATLLQIVSNLLINAGEATHARGAIEIRVERRGEEAVLEVHDDGPGVPPARRADLFRALATTKPVGSGLGLYSVGVCATSIGGRVEVYDSPLGGALFRVRMPLSRS